MGDTEAALATLSHSETVDPIFYQTFTIRGDILATLGDKAGALAAYRKSVALAGDDHGLLSAVGVYSAQTGDNDGALAAFKRLAELQQASLTATEQQLSDHNALVSRLGGYGGLLATASQRRDALQGSIPTIRSQLHLTYRNLALVLRDSGRTTDALQTARTALSYASDAERPTIEALISELQRKPGG
jgi:tetratricopeptide (TPR) repeat protein